MKNSFIMKNTRGLLTRGLALLGLGAVCALGFTGCLTSKTATVTTSTNSVTGQFTYDTNYVVTVNQANLELDTSALQLVGTPVLIYALQQQPAARPIVVDVQVALMGALLGVNTNVQSTINGLVGNNQALQSSIQPLIQSASALEQQLLAKYGSNNAVVISKAVLQADLNIVSAALTAVPAPAAKVNQP